MSKKSRKLKANKYYREEQEAARKGFYLFTGEHPIWRIYEKQSGRELGWFNTARQNAGLTGVDGILAMRHWGEFIESG